MEELIKKIKMNKAKLKALLKNKDNRAVLNKWLKTELAYTSNAIEGNTLTRRETTLAIEDNITSGAKPISHYLEAVNHAKAYEFIVEQAEHKIKIDEGVVLQIHKIILSGIDVLNAGFYRSVRVHISGSQTVLPNPIKVPDLMKEFEKWLATDKTEAIDKAIEAHYRIVSIHPFIDGNGRTSRLLMNLILLEAGYAPIIIRPIDRKRYLSALEARQTKDNQTTYLNFMLNALNRSLKTAIDLLDLEKADVNPNKLMTIAKFAKFVGVPVSTIRYWVEIKKIEPITYTESGYMLFDAKQKKDIKTRLGK